MNKLKKYFILFLVNNFLAATRFFKIKQLLLSQIIDIGCNTKVVGPIYFGNSISIKIGDNCWIGRNFNVDGDGELIIEDNVDIAPHVTVNTGGHEIGSCIRRAAKGKVYRVVIGSGSWIGTKTIIVNNSFIESGVVVAAGSTIIGDIPPNVLVAGVPAKIKKTLD